jgi:hypothetical protein
MNSDKPSHEDPNARRSPKDMPADAIPVLDEALEPFDPAPPSHLPDETPAMELSVELGYAADSGEETDDLADMEEIQTLPLAEMILDESSQRFASNHLDELASAEQKRHIATLEAIVFEGDDPTAPAPKYPPPEQEPAVELPEELPSPVPASGTTVSPDLLARPHKPLPIKSDNPFLPQHILDRLNAGKRNLVEEIAQSSAALDASTAILRTHARAERLNRPTYAETKPQQYSFARDKSAMQKQKIVDDLVEEYLPLIAAELRRRLRKILDE